MSYFFVLTLWLKLMLSCYDAPSAHGGSHDELWCLWSLTFSSTQKTCPTLGAFLVMTLILQRANNLDLKEE